MRALYRAIIPTALERKRQVKPTKLLNETDRLLDLLQGSGLSWSQAAVVVGETFVQMSTKKQKRKVLRQLKTLIKIPTRKGY